MLRRYQLSFASTLVAACGDPATLAVDAAIPDTESTIVQLGIVTDHKGNLAEQALVCVGQESLTCAEELTDREGRYAIALPMLPADLDLPLTIQREGFLTAVIMLHETASTTIWPSISSVFNVAAAQVLLQIRAGFTFPTVDTGFIRVRVIGASGLGEPGATATLASKTPVYLDEAGVPDRTLSATTSSGTILFGNVEPGPFELSIASPSKVCTLLANTATTGGWPPTGSGTLSGLVVANAITDQLVVSCF